MMFDQHAMEMNEKVRNINGEIRLIQQRSVLPVRLLDVAHLMAHSLPRDASSDGIHIDTPKGTEWLNGAFQRHINRLESDLLEMAQFTLGPPRSLLSMPLDPHPAVWERELVREIVQGVDGTGNQGPHRWRLRRRSLLRPRVRWFHR